MRKTIEEFGPLLVFFVLNARGAEWLSLPETQSLFVATGGFMLALGVAIASTYLRGEKPNNMTMASPGYDIVFGSITLFLQDETNIKIKPT
ncbi:MAG: septation protein IspZ [Pseudomonadota bacterium]|nr:septation protein IspZ [Pseudomonadota bacterium]